MLNKKITIACNEQGNVIEFLRERFNLVKPYIINKNNNIITNFDILLIFDEHEESHSLLKTLCKTHKIPYMGSNRYSKYYQTRILQQLRIPYPKTYKSVVNHSGFHQDLVYLLLSDFEAGENIIIKSERGAKGLAQILTTVEGLEDVFDKKPEEIEKEANDPEEVELSKPKLGGLDCDKKDTFSFVETMLRDGDFIIQPKLDLEKEWRYIYFFCDDPILLDREVTDWQTNISDKSKSKVIPVNDKNPDHVIMENYATQIAGRLDAPFLAIDFYKQSNGDIGCFEFQMHFAYKKLPKIPLVKSINNGVRHKINSILKTDIRA